jgi:hypothetical protein
LDGENLKERDHFADLHVCQGILKKTDPKKIEWVSEEYAFD